MRSPILVALVLGSFACANDFTGPARSSVTVSGTVLDFATSGPVPGATVRYIAATMEDTGVAAMTDAGGGYAMTLARGGEYQVMVNGTGRGIAYIGRAGYRADLIVNEGNCTSRYGRVTDGSGRPVSGARISLAGAQTTSGNDGSYRLDFGCRDTVGGGTTLMYVNRDGYEPWQRVVGRGVHFVTLFDVVLERSDD